MAGKGLADMEKCAHGALKRPKPLRFRTFFPADLQEGKTLIYYTGK
jgi:hypothetical protein